MRLLEVGERPPWWLWPLALSVVYSYFAAETRVLGSDWGFPLDDSWIHLQFARNLAAGQGLSFDAGEPSTASTAPLWTVLLSGLFLLPGDVVLWVKLAGALCYLAVVAATWALGRELGLSPPARLLASSLTLASSWLVWSALSGMEVLPFTALTLAGMVLHLSERRQPDRLPLALAVFALAALARPEGLLLLALATVDRLLLPGPSAAAETAAVRASRLGKVGLGLLLAMTVLVPAALAYTHLGGSPLPGTFAAKTAGARTWLPDTSYLRVVFGILFSSQPWMTLLAAGGALTLVRRLGTPRDRGLLPALWVFALPPAYSLLSPPGLTLVGNFGRYFFPLLPLVVLLGTLGLQEASRSLPERLRLGRWRLALATAVVGLLLWPTLAMLWRTRELYATNVRQVHESDVRMSRLVAEHLPPQALVAVADIGAFKYFAPQPIVDLVGLVSPDVQAVRRQAERSREPGGASRELMALLERRRPDFAMVFSNYRQEIFGDPTRYQPLAELPVPGNVTMTGERLVLYRTPWCRYAVSRLESPP